MLAMLLAVAMLPAAGLQAAHADEPEPTRPATTGGDMALEGVAAAGGGSVATDTGMGDVGPDTPAAEEREGGMLAADGLLYTVADGGLSLAGFDGEAPAGALAVPEVVSVDGRAVPIVAIAMGAGQVAEGVTALSLPRSVSEVSLPSLAPAFPALASVEVAPAAGPSLPAAAGAAALRSAYSSSGGMLFAPASVGVLRDGGAVELIECRELVWAPPALVSARIPVDCRAVAAGAFADVRNLQTVVCFGTMERIADGAFAEEQMATAKVAIPAASPAVAAVAEERVSASMALMNDAGQKERRYAWHEAGWRMGDIVMGKPYGSLTETVAVTDEGAVASGEAQLISYPDMHPQAMDVKHPGEDGKIDMADNGLAFTVKSDMTASVAWRGDPTATPAHVDIPASVVIDGVTYPVTEVAPNAFKGAVFLTSVAVPEGVAVIGEGAFEDCANLAALDAPASLREIGVTALKGTPAQLSWAPASEDAPTNPAEREPANAVIDSVEESGNVSSVQGSAVDNVVSSFPSVPEESLHNDASRIAHNNGAVSANDDYGLDGSGVTQATTSASDSDTDMEIAPYLSSSSFIQIATYPRDASNHIKYTNVKNSMLSGIGDGSLEVMSKSSSKNQWTAIITENNLASFQSFDKNNNLQVHFTLEAPDGMRFAAAGVRGQSSMELETSAIEHAYVTVVRRETMGSESLLTAADAADAYQPKGDYAASDHTHDSRYYTKAEVSTALGAKADANLLYNSGLKESAFTTANTVRGAINDLRAVLSTDKETAFTAKSTVRGAINTKSDLNLLAKGTDAEPAFTKDNTVRGALNAKADANHNHDDAYAAASHEHDADDITSGTLDTARIPNLDASIITSGGFGSDRIGGKAITTAKINDAAVTTEKIADANVTEAKLKDGAVTTKKIADLNVTEAKLAADAVTEGKIKNGSVTTNKIADANVTEGKLAADAVTTDKIKDANVTTEKLADKAVTNDKIADGTIADDKLASAFVKPTEFGSVRYEGVYDAEANTYPTMYRRGGTPAVHEPHREGYEFLGWEWQRAGSSPASGAGGLAPAFAEAGEVTLRATWKEVVPEANHFFTTDAPLKAEDNAEHQSHVVAVRLADFERSLRRVAFERNDATGLLREGAEIELWVGNAPDVIGTGTRLALGETDEAWLPGMPLARIGDASWGVYVGVRVRTADVDASRLVASYASGAYVVSLVKMSYEFA